MTLEGQVVRTQAEWGQLRVLAVDGAPAQFDARVWPGLGAAAGQRIAVRARLKPVPMSFGSSAERQAVIFSGSVKPDSVVLMSEVSALDRWLDSQHVRLRKMALRLAPSEAAAHVFLALAAGERAEVGEALELDFARSGLAHVLSVSGLHVAALGLFALWVLRWAFVLLPWRRLRRVDARALALWPALLLVWAYVEFTGAQAPAVRSAVMTSLLLLGAGVQRHSDPINALAVAAAVLVTIEPAAPFDLSTQLSLLSALGLMVLRPKLRALLPVRTPDFSQSGWRLRVQTVGEAGLQALCASVAVMTLTTPVLAASFERVGLAGLVSNVVCMPLNAGASIFAAAGAATSVAMPALAPPVVWLGVYCCELLTLAARGFSALPFAAFEVAAPAGWLVGLWVAAALGFALSKGLGRWWGAAVPVCAAWLFVGPQWSPHAPVEVTFLSVGHGDAIVVRAGSEAALIDGGGVPDGADVGQRVVLPFLRAQGIRRLRVAALSHPHPDHALGLTSALRVVPTDELWLPAGIGDGVLVKDLRGAAGSRAVERELEVGAPVRQLGEATFQVLGPPVDRVLLESENDRSLVLLLRHGAVSFLLTGDLEEAGEERIEAGPVTVMKAPHHGSRTSSTPGLLGMARPQHVVFCVGAHNRFGFPHREVVERYEALGARCYRTDRDGAVTFRSDGREVSVVTAKGGQR